MGDVEGNMYGQRKYQGQSRSGGNTWWVSEAGQRDRQRLREWGTDEGRHLNHLGPIHIGYGGHRWDLGHDVKCARF